MDILVVGSGGREHALIKKLKESPQCGKIYCCPGNGGISAEAECSPIPVLDIAAMVGFAKEKQVGLAVVAPDDPLAAGMVDAMEAAGIPAFGPNRAAAQIEASKVFAKELMRKYAIPTAEYRVFDDYEAAVSYVKEKDVYPVVLKADGLALGKGVLIAANEQEALDGLRAMLTERRFGDSGARVVVEQYLKGPEVSVLALTDGTAICPLASSMDHKRALDGDEGLNTGGMGVIAPNPFYTPEVARKAMDRIFLPTLAAMRKEARPFRGCLYFGLMIVDGEPYVIEYNCRFGDPEAQAVLPLLEGDLVELMLATRNGGLDKVSLRVKDGCSACVVLASGGYPGKYETGKRIVGLNAAGGSPYASICHAGTRREQGSYFTAGGRVLGVCQSGDTLDDALDAAYAAARTITFEGCHYRRDIGRKAGAKHGH